MPTAMLHTRECIAQQHQSASEIATRYLHITLFFEQTCQVTCRECNLEVITTCIGIDIEHLTRKVHTLDFERLVCTRAEAESTHPSSDDEDIMPARERKYTTHRPEDIEI